MTYPVNEMFATFQGEGVHMGKAAFFVRLHGCPVHCPWCDSAGTWHPNWVPKEVKKMTAEEILIQVEAEEMEMVVITGGEPAVYDLDPLVFLLQNHDIKVHLETSGGFPFAEFIDWVTLSPKKWKPPLIENVLKADEFKIIVENPDDIHFYHGLLLKCGMPSHTEGLWLHPEWSHREDLKVLNAIAAAVKDGGPTFRAGWQLHKLYQVDKMDVRSRSSVPLGGDPSKGL